MTGNGGEGRPPSRAERLEAALRGNLARRKAQARGRAALSVRVDAASPGAEGAETGSQGGTTSTPGTEGRGET